MKKDTAIDFLLFSVIGASSEDSCDELIEASIRRAYQDASSRIGYELKDGKERAVTKIVEALRDLDVHDQKSFNKWHRKTCLSILPKEEDKGYGKAQKWLNMSLKYLAVTYAVLAEKSNHEYVKNYREKLESCEKFFHIPIDSYICDALIWSGVADTQKNNPLPLKKQLGRKLFSEYANPYGDYVKSWSSWTEDDYERVADYLKSGQGNTDYDFDWEIHAWIKTARYRSCLEGKSESMSPGELRNDLKDSLR